MADSLFDSLYTNPVDFSAAVAQNSSIIGNPTVSASSTTTSAGGRYTPGAIGFDTSSVSAPTAANIPTTSITDWLSPPKVFIVLGVAAIGAYFLLKPKRRGRQ